jgi:hypothetical protein
MDVDSHSNLDQPPQITQTSSQTQNTLQYYLTHQHWAHAHSRTIFQLLPVFLKDFSSETRGFTSQESPQEMIFNQPSKMPIYGLDSLSTQSKSPSIYSMMGTTLQEPHNTAESDAIRGRSRNMSLLPSKPQFIISISMDRNISMWSYQKKTKVWDMSTLGGYIYGMSAMPLDPLSIALASGDNTIRVWSIQEMVQRMTESYQKEQSRDLERGGNLQIMPENADRNRREGDMEIDRAVEAVEAAVVQHDPSPDSLFVSPFSPFSASSNSIHPSICSMTLFWKGITGKVTSVVWHPSLTDFLAFGLEDGRIMHISLSSLSSAPDSAQSKSKKSKKSKNHASSSSGSPSSFPSSHSQAVLALSFVQYPQGNWMVSSVGADGLILLHSVSTSSHFKSSSSSQTTSNSYTSSDHQNSLNQKALDMNALISAQNPHLLRDLSTGIGKVYTYLPNRTAFDVKGDLCIIGNSDGSLEAYSWPSLSLKWSHRLHNRVINRIRWLDLEEENIRAGNHSAERAGSATDCIEKPPNTRDRAVVLTGSEDGSIGVIDFGLFGNSSSPLQAHYPIISQIPNAHSKSVNDLCWIQPTKSTFSVPIVPSPSNRYFFASCGFDGKIKAWSISLTDIKDVRSEGENEGHKPKHALSMLAVPIPFSTNPSCSPSDPIFGRPSAIIMTSSDDQSIKTCYFPKDFSFASTVPNLDKLNNLERQKVQKAQGEKESHSNKPPTSDKDDFGETEVDIQEMLGKQGITQDEGVDDGQEKEVLHSTVDPQGLPLKTRPKRKRNDREVNHGNETEDISDGKAEKRIGKSPLNEHVYGTSHGPEANDGVAKSTPGDEGEKRRPPQQSSSRPSSSDMASKSLKPPSSLPSTSSVKSSLASKKGPKSQLPQNRHQALPLFPDPKWVEHSQPILSMVDWMQMGPRSDERQHLPRKDFLALSSLLPADETSKSESWDMWNDFMGDDVAEMVVKAVKSGEKISEELVALSASGGYPLWKKTCVAYAEQLEFQGDHHKAATYYLAVRDIEKAISAYEASHRYQDAIMVGLKRLGGGLSGATSWLGASTEESKLSTSVGFNSTSSGNGTSPVEDQLAAHGSSSEQGQIAEQPRSHKEQLYLATSHSFTSRLKKLLHLENIRLEDPIHPRVEQSWRKWAHHLSHVSLNSCSAKCFIIANDIPSAILQLIIHLNALLKRGGSTIQSQKEKAAKPLQSAIPPEVGQSNLSLDSLISEDTETDTVVDSLQFLLPFQLLEYQVFGSNKQASIFSPAKAVGEPSQPSNPVQMSPISQLSSVISPSSLQSLFWNSVLRWIVKDFNKRKHDINTSQGQNEVTSSTLLSILLQLNFTPCSAPSKANQMEISASSDIFHDYDSFRTNRNKIFGAHRTPDIPSNFAFGCDGSYWQTIPGPEKTAENFHNESWLDPFKFCLYLEGALEGDLEGSLSENESRADSSPPMTFESRINTWPKTVSIEAHPGSWLSSDAYILFVASLVWSLIMQDAPEKADSWSDFVSALSSRISPSPPPMLEDWAGQLQPTSWNSLMRLSGAISRSASSDVLVSAQARARMRTALWRRIQWIISLCSAVQSSATSHATINNLITSLYLSSAVLEDAISLSGQSHFQHNAQNIEI